ncbi:MAG: hypothetical protein B7Y99_07405 [Caulobacterales bacterium 32-69-10]|nr:MAG: hypothetical protein B7Y99_07405 [Caulobacterales bacterium 32-69-10]
MTTSNGRLSWAGGVAFVCLLSISSAAVAQQRTYDIPAGDAARSLLAFARQSGLQITAPASQLRGLRTPAIRGQFDTRAALRILLAGTRLEVASDTGAIVVLRRKGAPSARPASGEPDGRPAPAAPEATSRGMGGGAGAVVADPARIARPSPPPEMERLVVTGTRLSQGGFTAPTPVTQLTSEALARRAPGSTAEVLNELPVFRASVGPSTTTRSVTANSVAQADLRGLGSVRTLTLVNGRRFPPVSAFGFAADMSQIPASMIDHVDVVTGGASAAYGSDAVAGVVNFVLDTKLDGVKAGVQFGTTQRGDQRETVLSLGYGVPVGRFHIIAGGDYARDEGAGSFYTRSLYADEPGLVGRISPTSPAQTITSGVESVFPSGGIVASGPLRGVAFTNAGLPYQFEYGTVVGNNQIGATSNYGHNAQLIWQLRHPFVRWNGMLAATYELDDRTELYAEVMGAFNKSNGGYADTLQSTFTVNASNPFIPSSLKARLAAAGLSDFTVGRFNDDVSPYFSQQTYDTERYALGVRGERQILSSPWRWEAYVQLGRTHQRSVYERMLDMPNFLAATNVVTDAAGRPACGPLAANPNLSVAQQAAVEPGCIPFNIFGQTNGAAALDYVTGEVRGRTNIRQDVGGFSFSGEPLSLPAGPVSLALGGEFREESVSARGDPRSRLGAWQVLNQQTYTGKTSVREAFAEAGVPLLNGKAFAHALGLNGALRITDYRRSGTEVTWKVGATWEPTAWARLRATQSRDIREPNLFELYGAGLTLGQSGVFNPFLQQTELRISTTPNGNPNLTSEAADSLTVGVVLQPTSRLARGLRVSVDYFDIDVRRVIGAQTVTGTIARCFEGDQALCDQIKFDSGGHITSVNLPQMNFASLATAGFDIELAYSLDLADLAAPLAGTLRLRNLMTLVTRNRRRDGLVTIDRNGFSNGGTAKLIGNFTGDYMLGPFSAGVQARYFSDVRWDPSLIGPDNPAYSPTLGNSVSRNLFPGQVLFNVNASYQLLRRGERTLQVYGVINNVFDRKPSQQGAIVFNVGGVQYYDIMGRQFRAGFRITL